MKLRCCSVKLSITVQFAFRHETCLHAFKNATNDQHTPNQYRFFFIFEKRVVCRYKRNWQINFTMCSCTWSLKFLVNRVTVDFSPNTVLSQHRRLRKKKKKKGRKTVLHSILNTCSKTEEVMMDAQNLNKQTPYSAKEPNADPVKNKFYFK